MNDNSNDNCSKLNQLGQPKPPGGVGRIFRATSYSMAGFRAAYIGEAAFRQLCWLAIVLIPLACFLNVESLERLLMIAVVLLSLIVELFNSAIEAVVDRISLEHHPLSGQAKDLGSAAQFVSIGLILLVWVGILLP